jgi:hypothetical protein
VKIIWFIPAKDFFSAASVSVKPAQGISRSVCNTAILLPRPACRFEKIAAVRVAVFSTVYFTSIYTMDSMVFYLVLLSHENISSIFFLQMHEGQPF